jgi:DNA invertase Pin-like site-specific DNA recombinase
MENEVKQVRCAIYTRKSTDENLNSEFNSLDAQREACENYIRIQAEKGWICLPEHYDDGGFSGGNTNRPALQRLLADIADGKVDLIVIYKLDRLSRSLYDFAGLHKFFEEHNVGFCSVTQEINTSTSSGRMSLSILMAFSEFERSIVTERIRDKMDATRRKGEWVGGTVACGYKLENKKLVVVPEGRRWSGGCSTVSSKSSRRNRSPTN